MSEQLEKLQATLAELKEELQSLEALDSEARQLLQSSLHEIEEALHQNDGEGLEHESLLERLRESAQQFEESHPALSRTLGGFIDTLSQMGI